MVHPHVCGEQLHRVYRITPRYGSSPRMWGTEPDDGAPGAAGRFIPTYVGNSTSCGGRWSRGTVHPHVCGEQCLINRTSASVNGSSPRMWGTGNNLTARLPNRRFIPTYVGNRHTPKTSRTRRSVHPHVCGEQPMQRALTNESAGSSPRMWGTGSTCCNRSCRARFIPTYVGNSPSSISSNPSASVHPHVCGEQFRPLARVPPLAGSSPRMWGTAGHSSGWLYGKRFIPTYVGNSPSMVLASITIRGSSPRMWGTAP